MSAACGSNVFVGTLGDADAPTPNPTRRATRFGPNRVAADTEGNGELDGNILEAFFRFLWKI